MDSGVVRLAASSSALLADPRVAELYLGAAPAVVEAQPAID
jgi:hypothetical protein